MDATGGRSGGLGDTQGDTRAARDNRTNEAIAMKDRQIQLLQDQTSQLLRSLDKVGEDAAQLHMGKLAVEEENRTLREQNFELQSKSRADQNALKRIQAEFADKDKQLRIVVDQHAELLRLLETEEAQNAKLQGDLKEHRTELEGLRQKYANLLTTAKTHEEMAQQAAREAQLRGEELRLLRAEVTQLRNQNVEMKRKMQVELESLQEQLRVRKEKQYSLLERTQAAEEAKRQSDDQVAAMEEKLRGLHAKTVELETQLQVEARAKRAQQEANKKMANEENNLRAQVGDLQAKVEKAESERLRMEAEARDSSDQLREMAEKVFQLLERLKLAELGKSKAVEALRTKESELTALKKKNSRLLKESTKEGKARVKAELDKKVLIDQIRALKKHNAQLALRSKEEVKAKLKEHEERKAAQEKVRTLSGRLTFLLNKLQADEEAKVIQREEIKKLEAQLRTLQDKNEEMSAKLSSTGESNRIITQALRLKQEELEALSAKHEAIVKQFESAGGLEALAAIKASSDTTAIMNATSATSATDSKADNQLLEAAADMSEPSSEAVRQAGGKGRFYVESKPSQGLLLIKAPRPNAKELLERLDINEFLRKAQKSVHFKERIIEKVSHLLGLVLVEEEDRAAAMKEHTERRDQVDHLQRKSMQLQDRLSKEEEAKRRTLLRYVDAVKKTAEANAAAAEAGAVDQEVVRRGAVVQLPDSGIGDEEMHALAALLRGNTTVAELVLRGNAITDEGARALAAVLAGPCALRAIDLRANHITKSGLRALAEALERSERVRHVYVHAGGKIEALGTGLWAAPRSSVGEMVDTSTATGMMAVETVCAVDVRDNTLPPNPLADAGSPRGFAGASTASMDGPGVSVTSSVASHTSPGVKKDRKTEERERKEAEKQAKLAERELRRTQQAEKEKKRLEEMEGKWKGRAGGLDIATLQRTKSANSGEDPSAMTSTLPKLKGGIPSSTSMASLPRKK